MDEITHKEDQILLLRVASFLISNKYGNYVFIRSKGKNITVWKDPNTGSLLTVTPVNDGTFQLSELFKG